MYSECIVGRVHIHQRGGLGNMASYGLASQGRDNECLLFCFEFEKSSWESMLDLFDVTSAAFVFSKGAGHQDDSEVRDGVRHGVRLHFMPCCKLIILPDSMSICLSQRYTKMKHGFSEWSTGGRCPQGRCVSRVEPPRSHDRKILQTTSL